MSSDKRSIQKKSEPPAQPGNSNRDPLEVAISEYTELKRLGQSPSIDEFASRYPALATEIQELFPLIENLERWKNNKEVECLRRNVPKEFPFDQLGDYKLVKELGRGGMGVVFEGFHQVSHHRVAIKLLPWRFAADMPVWKSRLQREASTIAALKHPNIVQIYSFAEDQGYYYYVMQLIEGECLDKIIGQLRRERTHSPTIRRFPTEDSVAKTELTWDSWRGFAKVADQVAQAISCAHRHEVLHNDIKPSNLIVRSNGQVILTDFGIGRPRESDVEDDDHSVGTLRYMAPERWQGSSTPRSDIYSLGVTLYELATQTPIFDVRQRSQLRDAVLKNDPIPPSRHVPDIPPPLERIIMKSIAKDPRDRYESAIEMANDLRRFINRQPVKAKGKNLFQRAIAWWSKRSPSPRRAK